MKRRTKRSLIHACAIVVGLAALCYVDRVDRRAAELEHDTYCENVADRLWPDFKRTFHTCPQARRSRFYAQDP